MSLIVGIFIFIAGLFAGFWLKQNIKPAAPEEQKLSPETITPPDSFVYLGGANLSNMNKEHIRGMMHESPHMVEVEDPFPWYRFELWGKDSLIDYHFETEDCMGSPHTKVSKSYGTLPLKGEKDTQLFAFRSAEEKWLFIKEFKDIVVLEQPFKFLV